MTLRKAWISSGDRPVVAVNRTSSSIMHGGKSRLAARRGRWPQATGSTKRV
jgi:hypothetical protein